MHVIQDQTGREDAGNPSWDGTRPQTPLGHTDGTGRSLRPPWDTRTGRDAASDPPGTHKTHDATDSRDAPWTLGWTNILPKSREDRLAAPRNRDKMMQTSDQP